MHGDRRRNFSLRRLSSSSVFSISASGFSDDDFMHGYDQFMNVNCWSDYGPIGKEWNICECSSLKSICIPLTATTLGNHCFSCCDSLSDLSFELDSKRRTIDQYAFVGCSPLKSICIPSSVTVLGTPCFDDCTSLSVVRIESDSKLDDIHKSTFEWCSSLKSICIPSSITVLGSHCFCSSDSLSVLQFESGEAREH
jgi:hypothetical protein